LYRMQRRSGDRDAVLQSLSRIGMVYIRNAENALRMSQEIVAAPPLFATEDKLREVDRYLVIKTAEVRAASHANLRSWDYLLDAAARASGIEDASWEHCPRVARLALLVAQRLGLTSDQVGGVEAGALLHDVGKLGVADIILRNTEMLDDKEAELYNAHAEAGAQLLERADISHKRTVIDVIRLHHTPYDGRGERAASVQGDAIPLAARIVAACDAFDALVMGRPRRAAMSVPEALKEILRQSGRDFDPRVVVELIETVRQLQREHGDVMQYLSDVALEIEYFATQRMLRRAARGAG
jgi:putative nucleotidyltransferase with HDIG domain